MIRFLLAFTGTVAFSELFHVPRKYYFWCGLTGCMGYMTYCMAGQFFSKAVSSFLATLVIVLVSRIFAVLKKCPITIFLMSGIFPIIPGSNAYYTAYHFVNNDLELANRMGIESLKVAFSIVLGIIMVLSVPSYYFLPKYQLKLSFVKRRKPTRIFKKREK